MVLPFAESHNMVANLSTTSKESKPFKEIVKFLNQSEISFAISANTTIFEEHIRSFWSTAQFVIKDNRRYVSALVQGKRIEITEATIRSVLKLKSTETYEMSNQELVTVLQKMGYEGDSYNLKMVKSQVGYNWRYLWHVIIHVFAARKAGWDTLNIDLAKGMACLCLNRPFNWANLILENLKFNTQCSVNKKFLLYPRFLELIFVDKLKEIKFEGNVLIVASMKDRVWSVMKHDHPRSTFSKRFTPLFQEMLIDIAESSSSEEEVEVHSASTSSSSEEQQRMFDPRTKKFVEAQQGPSATVQHATEESSSDDDVPLTQAVRRGPRFILKKSTLAKRAAAVITDPEDVERVRTYKRPRVTETPQTPIAETVTEPPRQTEDESVRSLVLKLINDVEVFKQKMIKDLSSLKNEMKNEIHKSKEELIEKIPEMISKEFERRKFTVGVDKEQEDDEGVNDEAENVRDNGADFDAFHQSAMDFDFSFLEEHRIPADTEVVLHESDPMVVSTEVAMPIQSIPETDIVQVPISTESSVVVYAEQPVWSRNTFYGFGKGKKIVVDELVNNGSDEDLQVSVADVKSIMQIENEMLPSWILESNVQSIDKFFSKKIFVNEAFWILTEEEDVVFLSEQEERDVTMIEGCSKMILIEDVNVEEEEEKEKLNVELKKRLSEEKKIVSMIEMAEKRRILTERLKADKDFEMVFERLKLYLNNAESLWYRSPDDIIKECFEKDCARIVDAIYERCKSKPDDVKQILEDLSIDVSTLPISQLKEFLRRYGFISFQINKMSIETMIEEAKEVQLRLLKKVPREQAEQMFEAGLFDIPQDFEVRARFFSSQFPQLSTQRIVHWRYDSDKGCFLVKRVTGATHALYSAQDVARLTEEDLYELADLRIDDKSDDEEVYQFTRFLKRQKSKNFEDINFAHPQSIRALSIAYLKSEGMSLREILKDQYLCLRFKDVPKRSTTNLLDNLKRWYLDDRSFEYVFERSGLEAIKFYHPAEINMFTKLDLIKITSTPPVGKREWNACILEMLIDIAKNLISKFPQEQGVQQEKTKKDQGRKKDGKGKKKKRSGAGIEIAD